MKIVLAIHHFPPSRNAGAELQAYRSALTLGARGHDVRIVCVDSITASASGGALTWRDEAVTGLPVRRLSFNLAATPDPTRWEYDNLWIGDHLRDYFLDFRPDLFHLYSGYLISARPLLVATELGIPTVVTLTEFWFLCSRLNLIRSDGALSMPPLDPAVCARCLGEERRRYRYLGRLAPGLMQMVWRLRMNQVHNIQTRTAFLHDALEQAGAVICLSQFVADMFVRAGYARERFTYCHQGHWFPQLTTESLQKRPAQKLRIGFFGQLAWHKGVHVLIDALRRMPAANVSLQLYGDPGQDPQYVSSLRAQLAGDTRVHFAGRFERDQISRVFQELDGLVVPSVCYENSPNVIFEAFAHRTPVVASNLGGMAELVQHGKNGLLFAVGDADDLAAQLMRLLDEPNLLTELAAGIAPVKTLQQETDELEQIYRSLVPQPANVESPATRAASLAPSLHGTPALTSPAQLP